MNLQILYGYMTQLNAADCVNRTRVECSVVILDLNT